VLIMLAIVLKTMISKFTTAYSVNFHYKEESLLVYCTGKPISLSVLSFFYFGSTNHRYQ